MPFKADRALQLIGRAMKGGRLGHAYLITGPDEADREGFAVRVLNQVSGEKHRDLDDWMKFGTVVLRPQSKSRRITIGDDGDERGTVRYLDKAIHMTSGFGGHKFGVIVDADRMNPQAQNAFLRTLEEPPPRTLFLMLTGKPGELLPTIISRVIEIELIPESGARKYSEHELKLLSLLDQQARRTTSGSVGAALSLKTAFEEVLDDVRTEIEEGADDDLAREKEHFGKTTDSSAYLKNREEQLKASVEASYLHQRDTMLELLLAWMGDVVRHKVGAEHFDVPEQIESTRALADKLTIEEASRRVKVLNKLEQHLHTNVSENLALEVCFIEAFGS